MNDIQDTHRLAMEHVDLATLARMRGNDDTAAHYLARALELEEEAAAAYESRIDAEPSRSVLFRSAATIAFNCKLYTKSEQLIYKALLGQPPKEIGDELRDLLDQISFQRHLELRGISIGPEEFQLSITGKSVGFGIAPLDAFYGRVRSTESLLFRTAERQQGRDFRERGARTKALNDNMQLFLTAPRAACFAVTFRIGNKDQPSLPGLSIGEPVIDELLECLDLYTNADERGLRNKISDEAYYRNFVSLVQNLEPDGTDVDMVGFTTLRHGRTRKVAIRRSINDRLKLLPTDVLSTSSTVAESSLETMTARGVLKLADARRRQEQIEIMTSGNTSVKLIVPTGMMSDIVRPLWDREVEVEGTKRGNKNMLVRIRPA